MIWLLLLIGIAVSSVSFAECTPSTDPVECIDVTITKELWPDFKLGKDWPAGTFRKTDWACRREISGVGVAKDVYILLPSAMKCPRKNEKIRGMLVSQTCDAENPMKMPTTFQLKEDCVSDFLVCQKENDCIATFAQCRCAWIATNGKSLPNSFRDCENFCASTPMPKVTCENKVCAVKGE